MADASKGAEHVATAERLYNGLKPLLLLLAFRRFRIPYDEAEELVHDVFLDYLRRRPRIENERAWFVGAICHASRHYWRRYARYIELDAEMTESLVVEPVDVPTRITARALIQRLPERDQLVLQLRFFEQCPVRRLGAAIGVSASRGEKLLRRALRNLADLDRPAAADDIHSFAPCGVASISDAFTRHHVVRCAVPLSGSRTGVALPLAA